MTFEEKMDYLYEKLHELDDEEIPHEEFISKLSELLNEAKLIAEDERPDDLELFDDIVTLQQQVYSLKPYTIH